VTWIDAGIAALCLGFALAGLIQGFVRQAASWAGIVLGHVLGIAFHPTVQEALAPHLRTGDAAAAYIAVFIGVYAAARLLGLLVEGWVRGSRLSGTDRFAGGLAGLAKGALAAILLVFLMSAGLPRDYEPLRRSRLAPPALTAGDHLGKVFPERIRISFRQALRLVEPPGGQEETTPSHPKKRSRK
jgi:membrane protein required for colicin V production